MTQHVRDARNRCGPKCLHELLARAGIHVEVSDVAQWCRTSPKGTSIRHLVAAAAEYGLGGDVTMGDMALLASVTRRGRCSVIAHVRGSHFVVVERVSQQGVVIWDPVVGCEELSASDFQAIWQGVAIVLTPPQSAGR